MSKKKKVGLVIGSLLLLFLVGYLPIHYYSKKQVEGIQTQITQPKTEAPRTEAPKPAETTSESVTIPTPKTTTKPTTNTPTNTTPTPTPTPQPVVTPPVKTCVADTATIAVLEAQKQSELMNAEVKRTNGVNAIPYQDSSYYQRRVAEVEMVYQNTINSVNSIYNAKIQAVPKICTTQ